jgi:hypothetical protein
MTAAQFEDPEGRDLVEAIHARKWDRDYGAWITVPTTTRPIHLPTDEERA